MTIAVFVELLFAIAQLIAAASFICDQLPVKKVGVACCHDFRRRVYCSPVWGERR
jgi:hypothetical protein